MVWTSLSFLHSDFSKKLEYMNFWCVYMHWLAVFGDVVWLPINGCAGHFERKFGIPPRLFIATVLVLYHTYPSPAKTFGTKGCLQWHWVTRCEQRKQGLNFRVGEGWRDAQWIVTSTVEDRSNIYLSIIWKDQD